VASEARVSEEERPVAGLAKLDLNLLVILRELIRERNVTRAAERLAVTQPAASAALARLRRYFDDELLVRHKGHYELSPLAAQLAEQVELACSAAERVFTTDADFDPATTTREFTLMMADYTIAVMGEQLSQQFERLAPGARLHLRLVRESLAVEAAETIRQIEGIVAPPMSPLMLPHVRSIELFRDRWVCVAAAGNRIVSGDSPTIEELAGVTWVAPYLPEHGRPWAAPVSQQFAMLGIHPHAAIRVESYQAVPYLVAGTDRVALMQERLVCPLAERLDLKVMECPGASETIVEALWWCDEFHDDPAHVWLRQTIARAASAL
jgi:DNA-binding transcriptional LysR family regulator